MGASFCSKVEIPNYLNQFQESVFYIRSNPPLSTPLMLTLPMGEVGQTAVLLEVVMKNFTVLAWMSMPLLQKFNFSVSVSCSKVEEGTGVLKLIITKPQYPA